MVTFDFTAWGSLVRQNADRLQDRLSVSRQQVSQVAGTVSAPTGEMILKVVNALELTAADAGRFFTDNGGTAPAENRAPLATAGTPTPR